MRVSFVNQDGLLKNLKKLGFYPKVVFDVGVANGTPWLYSAFPDAMFYLFEPVESFEPAIAKILQEIRGEHVRVALGSQCKKVTFYVPRDQGKHQIATVCFEGTTVPEDTKHEIDMITLDSFTKGLPLPQPILLKTDAQGFDLDVAKGAVETLKMVDLVITETPMYGPWGGGPELKDYIEFYFSNGFILYDMVEPLRRPDDDRLHSIDLCFASLRSPITERNLYGSGKETLNRARAHYERMQEARQRDGS
jgi:FkbM family methyltransferase